MAMLIMQKILFYLFLWIVNAPLKGTHFFKLKRFMLNCIGITVGLGTKVVGPIKVTSASNVEIGKDCWIGENFRVHGNGEVKIGDRNDFGPEVTFLTGSHEIGSPKRRAGKGISEKFNVGDGNWIGARCVFIKGITVEEGTVIGTKSLINSDCKSNALYAGSPIRKIRNLEA